MVGWEGVALSWVSKGLPALDDTVSQSQLLLGKESPSHVRPAATAGGLSGS